MKKQLGGKDICSVPKLTAEIKILTTNICQEYFMK
jgi:hypothetical protein